MILEHKLFEEAASKFDVDGGNSELQDNQWVDLVDEADSDIFVTKLILALDLLK